MDIHKHPRCNHSFGAPPDMLSEQCAALPVILFEDVDGRWAQSFFKPTEEELAALNQGAAISLFVRVSGEPGLPPGHPVVALAVCPELTEPA